MSVTPQTLPRMFGPFIETAKWTTSGRTSLEFCHLLQTRYLHL